MNFELFMSELRDTSLSTTIAIAVSISHEEMSKEEKSMREESCRKDSDCASDSLLTDSLTLTTAVIFLSKQ